MKNLTELAAEARNHCEATNLFRWGLPMMKGTLAAAGTLVVVGGRTGSGKSMLGLKLLESVADQVDGLFVSLEDPLPVVGMRARQCQADVRDRIWATRPLRPRIKHVANAVREANLQTMDLRIVVYDYAQLLMSDARESSRTEELAEIIAEIKGLATELGHVAVLNSQLRRPAPDRVDEFPTIWELRDSASLENCAESVVLLGELGPTRVRAELCKNKIGKRGADAVFERGNGGWLTEVVAEQPADSDDDSPY